jgi:hypothetical protein
MKLMASLLSAAVAAALFPLAAVAGSINVGNGYWMMSFDTSGTEPIWANNKDSFGISQTSAHGYCAMMLGCHWGNCGQGGGILPKRISSIGGNCDTWFSQSSSAYWGYDACYDIWFDASPNPSNRNSAHELMLWLQWNHTQPIAASYDASGNAVPYARNVSLGGYTWNVYYRNGTFSFLLVNQSSWISTQVKPFWQYAVARGWMGSTEYLNSVQAGWENLGGGAYQAYSFGVAGL